MDIKKVLPYDKDWRKRNVSSLYEIILHHAEWYKCTIQDIERDHAKKWAGGFGYNYFINKNGDIFEGRPEDVQTAGASGHNLSAIHICVEGNYHPSNKQSVDISMPKKQFDSVVWLIKDIQKRHKQINKILGHKDVNATNCPGQYYPFKEVVEKVNEKVYSTIRKGSKGQDVIILQTKLKELGYNIIIDGDFGKATDFIVRQFQLNNNLDSDGIVGKNTWNALLVAKKMNYIVERPNSYTTIVKIPKEEVKKIDVILCNQPTETLSKVYNRLSVKPTFILNGGLFAMNNGNSMSSMYDEGKKVIEGYFSDYGLYVKKNENFGFGNHKSITDLRDFIGASPTLIIDNNIHMDLKGLRTDKNFISGKHPRSAIGMDGKYLYLITVDGRRIGKPGMTLFELALFGIDLNLQYMINLDGGGSTRLIDKNGEPINSPSENRAVDSCIAIYVK